MDNEKKGHCFEILNTLKFSGNSFFLLVQGAKNKKKIITILLFEIKRQNQTTMYVFTILLYLPIKKSVGY